MIERELPPIASGLALLALGTPFLVLALRKARALLPARPSASFRWSGGEVAAVVATPFVLVRPLGLLIGDGGPVAALLVNELLLGLTVGLALVLSLRRPGALAAFGLGFRPTARSLLAVALVFVPLHLVVASLQMLWLPVCRWLRWEEEQEVMHMIIGLGGGELLVAGLVAVVIGPLLEELLFRGFLQPALGQVAGERGGLILSSALFAGLHGAAGLPLLFVLSLFLGWLQSRTRNLLVPWSAHALHNGVSLALALALTRG